MKIKDYNEKIKIVDQYIKINEKNDIDEIKQKGVIYTPIEISEKMLDEFVKSYKNDFGFNVFEEEKLKWYDNSFGIGNIILVVYLKLMDGLKEKIPEYNSRKKHILENMLYMSEINEKSVEKFKLFVNKKNKYKLNIYTGGLN